MIDYDRADYYSDPALVDDPHAYFDYLRAKGPVTRLPYRNAVAVTGYEEVLKIMADTEHFSSVNAASGAALELPFTPQGDDIEDQLEAARPRIEFANQIATLDGERHLRLRGLLRNMFTPSRLKALEDGLYRTSDALIEEFIGQGKVDLPRQYGGPYATLVIGQLLGIPDDGRQRFRELVEKGRDRDLAARLDQREPNPIEEIGKEIYVYVVQRRAANAGREDGQGDDILTKIALAEYPDGSLPELPDLAALGAFLFAAGQDTTNLLVANAFMVIAERPDIQQELRESPQYIPAFVEEILRYDGSVKAAGRLCKKTTTVGGMEIKAGTPILLSQMGGNRDPRRFENPREFNIHRPNAHLHLAFSRGPHACIGAPLARREAAISIERLLARMGNIRLSTAHHGPKGNRRFEYVQDYTLRSLRNLHLEFERI